MSSNLWNWLIEWLIGSTKSRESQDTYNLLSQVRVEQGRSPLYPQSRADDFRLELINEICEKRQVTPSIPLGEALWITLYHLLHLEGFIVNLPDASSIEHLTLEEGVELRTTLNRHLRFIAD